MSSSVFVSFSDFSVVYFCVRIFDLCVRLR